MERFTIVLYSCLVAFSLIQQGNGLKCYKCNGYETDDCAKPSDHAHLAVECESDKNVCVFENITVIGEPPKLIRDCGNNNSCGTRSELHNVTCKICEENLCNSSDNFIPSLILSFVGFVVILLSFQ